MTDQTREKAKLESKTPSLNWDALQHIGLYTSPLLKVCSEGEKTEYKPVCMQAKTTIEAFVACLKVSDKPIADKAVEAANIEFQILVQRLSALTFGEPQFAEMRRVIHLFTALCQTEIQATLNPERSPELTLEFDAIRRLYAQIIRLKDEITLKYSGSFFCELFKPLDEQFSDSRLRAHVDLDHAPARRADQSLIFLIAFFEFAKVYKYLNKDLLELPPLLRLYRAEAIAWYRELRQKSYGQELWCVELQKHYQQLSQSTATSFSVLEEEIRLTARQILNKEDACHDALMRIKKLLPTQPGGVMTFLLSDPISIKTTLDKTSAESKQEAGPPRVVANPIEPSPVTVPERMRARELQDTLFSTLVEYLGKARQAARQAKERYDRWNIFLRDVQSASFADNGGKDLQALIKNTIREVLSEPRPYEHAICALQVLLTYRIKQPGMDSASIDLWRKILVETEAALQIKHFHLEPDTLPVFAPSLDAETVVVVEHKEEKRRDAGFEYPELEWETLLYLGRNAAVVVGEWIGPHPLKEFEFTIRCLYNKKKMKVLPADLAKARSLLLDIILVLQEPGACDGHPRLDFFLERCAQEISAHYYPTAFQPTFTWEELRSLSLLVKYWLSEYGALGARPYVFEKIFVNGAPQLRRYPFLKPGYHFASWFNTDTDSVAPPFLAFSYELIDNLPMPFSMTTPFSLRRAHQDLYAIVSSIYKMRVRVPFEHPVLSNTYKELPRVNVFMCSMRTLIETRICELRDDYAIAYQQHIQLFKEYQQLVKEYAILRQEDASKAKQITAGVVEGMDREGGCQEALRRVGIFAARSKTSWLQEISPIIAELKATKTSAAAPAKVTLVAPIALPAFEPVSMQAMTSHLLDWESLEKIPKSVAPCVESLSTMSYYYATKQADRRVLVELIRRFSHYFSTSASRSESRLKDANIVLATLIDRLVNSPNFPTFIEEHPQLHEWFLYVYDAEIRTVLETGLVDYTKIIADNHALKEKTSTLSAKIQFEQSMGLSSSATVRSQVIRALIKESERRRPYEQVATMTGYIASHVPRDSAADTIITEISRGMK